VAYYTVKNDKLFYEFESLLEISAKLGAELREDYSNKKRCKNIFLCFTDFKRDTEWADLWIKESEVCEFYVR
jgi:hypothetical protein